MEAPEDVACPQCTAGEPERVFLTPPSIRSSSTTFTDKTLQGLAADHGLSNMSNAGGGAVRRAPTEGPHATSFAADGAMMGRLAKLGAAGDNASGVLPMLRRAGRPHQWARTSEGKK